MDKATAQAPLASDSGAWTAGGEDVEWGASRGSAGDGSYRACVPPLITDLALPGLDPEVLAESAEATAELVRFDAEVGAATFAGGGDGVAEALLLVEALCSSRIENIRTDARAVALASIRSTVDLDPDLVVTNGDAIERALALAATGADVWAAEALLGIQATLLDRSAPEKTGRFRSRPVWIGRWGSTPHTATFVPPVAERVAGLIGDLGSFGRRVDVSALVHVAVAHAQFETIHPFPDGNGRTGRALAHAMLREHRITRHVVAPVSLGLLRDVRAYYAALGAYRDGDLGPIVAVFTRAAFDACSAGRSLADDLREIRSGWEARVQARRHAAVWNALRLVMARPAVTVNGLAATLDVSYPAAQRAIDAMVDAAILSPVGTRKRNRVWVADEVPAAIDKRAGSLQVR